MEGREHPEVNWVGFLLSIIYFQYSDILVESDKDEFTFTYVHAVKLTKYTGFCKSFIVSFLLKFCT